MAGGLGQAVRVDFHEGGQAVRDAGADERGVFHENGVRRTRRTAADLHEFLEDEAGAPGDFEVHRFDAGGAEVARSMGSVAKISTARGFVAGDDPSVACELEASIIGLQDVGERSARAEGQSPRVSASGREAF